MIGPGTVQDPADIALLREYEPIVRYNQGELFFPTAVEGYLAECDLLITSPRENDGVLVLPLCPLCNGEEWRQVA